MKTIWGRTGGGEWRQITAHTDPHKPLVIGKAINEPGYCIYHVKSGGSVVTRPKLAELRPLLSKLLAMRDVDWGQDFKTLGARMDLASRVRQIIGAHESLHVSERAIRLDGEGKRP